MASSTIDISCNGCGQTGVATIGVSFTNLSVGEKINVSGNACETCGSTEYSAPGGKYVRNDIGHMARQGDIDTTSDAPDPAAP